MTKKLEELLNLPESQSIVDEEKAKEDKADVKKVKIEDHESTKRDIAELDKMAMANDRIEMLKKYF